MCVCATNPGEPVGAGRTSYDDLVRPPLFQVHIIMNPNNVVWFFIQPTAHLNLTHRSPTLWMEYLYPNLTSDWRNSDNLYNNPSPNRTNPARIISITLIVHACFICLACYFLVCVSLIVVTRSRRIEDVESTRWSPEDKSRRHRTRVLE